MREDERKASEPKGVYRVRNWAEYNKGLIARGDMTMCIDEGVLTQAPEAGPSRRGRPYCIDPVEPAQVRQLKRMPQPGFSSSAPGGAVDGCRTESSRRLSGWRVAASRTDVDAHIAL